ncbi:hypothetical protein [Streptomyces sp. NPDC059909]|uniref:hypothetical protein n=1 Tax=Streptomyces sp. NPDC059909 TaxID=3346998 RepID=UPI003653C734
MEAIDSFFRLSRHRLVDSGFRAGCPIVAVALGPTTTRPSWFAPPPSSPAGRRRSRPCSSGTG